MYSNISFDGKWEAEHFLTIVKFEFDVDKSNYSISLKVGWHWFSFIQHDLDKI